MCRRVSSVVKKFIILLLAFCAVRAAIFFGAEEAAHAAALAAAQSEETVSMLLDLGFGSNGPKKEMDFALKTLFSESPLLRSGFVSSEDTEPAEMPYYLTVDESGVFEAEDAEEPETTRIPADNTEETEESLIVETTITGDDGNYGAEGIYIKNRTDYEIDIAGMLSAELNLKLGLSEPQILIIHTHGSEAFTSDGRDVYEETDPWRTENLSFNAVALGDALAESLEARGIPVIHDRELYDYPSYSGSYTRAGEAIKDYLAEYTDIKIVLDLHRDALMSDDGTVYKTIADIEGDKCAQIMIIAGSDYSGLEHPKWRENLKLALRLQAAMNKKYPTLARPLTISQYRYNQHLTTGSLIVEIGCNGNTLAEAKAAVNYFAGAAADVFSVLK